MQPSSPAVPGWAKCLPFYYGWVIVAVSWLSIFMSAPGQTYVVSVFVEPIIHDTGWSRNLVSGLYTAGSLTAALGVLLVGRLLDRWGARVTLTAVVVAFGGAVLWMSQVTAPVHLFIGFVALRTLGQGSLTLIATTMVATWFVRQRGRASVLTTFASPVSQATFPLLAHGLITHLGWRQAWIGFAVLVWGIVLLPAMVVVRRTPESVGLQPDGDPAPRPAVRCPARLDSAKPEGWTLHEACRTRTFWLLLCSSAAASLVSTALTFHHVALLASKGFAPGLAAGVLSFMAPMALAGNVVASVLVDRVPNRFVLASALALLGLAVLWARLLTAPWHGFVYGGMLGLSQGMTMMVKMVIWPNYFGRRALGSIRGVASTAMVAAAALGPLPFGYVVTRSGSYNTALLVFVLLPLLCMVTSLLAVAPTRLHTRETDARAS